MRNESFTDLNKNKILKMKDKVWWKNINIRIF